jgi:hypothetical protein
LPLGLKTRPVNDVVPDVPMYFSPDKKTLSISVFCDITLLKYPTLFDSSEINAHAVRFTQTA